MPDGIAMSITRVARRLRVSKKTVLRWIHSGELAAVNLGGEGHGARWRVFEDHLNAFIHARFLDSGKAASVVDSDTPS